MTEPSGQSSWWGDVIKMVEASGCAGAAAARRFEWRGDEVAQLSLGPPVHYLEFTQMGLPLHLREAVLVQAAQLATLKMQQSGVVSHRTCAVLQLAATDQRSIAAAYGLGFFIRADPKDLVSPMAAFMIHPIRLEQLLHEPG